MMIKLLIDQYKKYGLNKASKNLIYHFLTRERHCSFGKLNKQKIFYVIRSIDNDSKFYIGPRNNLLANYFYVLSHLQYAKLRGWIPVVDQLNYKVYNSVSFSVNGSKNAWEYYWKQPSKYTLDEVYNSRHVVLSKQNWFSEFDMGYDISQYHNRKLIELYHYLMESVPFNEATENHIRRLTIDILPANEKVLAVNYRFGGHSLKHYDATEGHPVQPEIVTLIELVYKKMAEWNMNYVYLASDTQEAIASFKRVFGNKLVYLDRQRMSENLKKGEHNSIFDAEVINTTSLGYLAEMELLSKCNALLGTINSGFRYALIKNNNQYENVEVLDFGLIGKG